MAVARRKSACLIGHIAADGAIAGHGSPLDIDRSARGNQVTEENLAAYLAVLKKYGVNTTWAGDPFGYGKYDKRGILIEPPAREMAEQWLGKWPAARRGAPCSGGAYT